MYNVSNELKNKLNSNSVISTARLTFSNPQLVIDENNLVSLKLKDYCYNEGRIIGTNIAKDLEVVIKNNNYDLQDKEFYLEIGVLLDNGKYEYIPYGYFIIDTVEDTKSNNEYKITAMDYMIKLNPDFIEFDASEYPMTMRQFLNKFAEQCGIELAEQTLPNETLVIPNMPYFTKTSRRTILKQIAEVFGRFAKFNREGKLEFVLRKNVDEKISRDNMNSNLEIDNSYGEVNVVSILLSDDIIGENVTLRDEESIALYGENIIKIVGNEFLNTQDMRNAAIQSIFNELKGFKYIPTSFTYMAKPYLDCGDTILVQDMETDEYYESIVLNHSIEIAALRKSKMENLALTKVEVESQFTPEDIKRNSRTEARVDKVEKKISLVVEEQTTQSNRITNVEKETNTVASNLNTFINETYSNDISNLQDQIDGAIQFWNGESIPTLSNYPASEWTTEEQRNNHRADIYTVIQDIDGEMKQGKSYRFDKVETTWQWVELTDNELSAVQALANSKAKVYVTTPIVPYNVGDLWLKDKELYECIKSKDASGSYSANDWVKATKYTDDTKANEVDGKLTTTNKKVATIELNLDSVTTRVSATETKITTVETTANTAKSTAEKAQSTVDNLQVGGRNLFVNTSKYQKDTPYIKTTTSKDGIVWQFDNNIIHSKQSFKADEIVTIQAKSNLIWSSTHGGYIGGCGCFLYFGTYEQITNGQYVRAIFLAGDNTNTEFVKTITIPQISKDGVALEDIYIAFRWNLYSDGTTELTGKLWDVKLEKGNKVTDWTPAPEDIEADIQNVENQIITTNTKVASIETNLTSITSRVSETETGIKEIEQAIDSENNFERKKEVQIESIDNILKNVEMYGELQQKTREGYNLLPITLKSQIINGVTITVNDDKTITFNGTASAYFVINLFEGSQVLPIGNYNYSLGNKNTGINFIGVENNTEVVYLASSVSNTYRNITLNGVKTLTLVKSAISSGTVFNNFTIYPMIYKGTEIKEYEQYGVMPSPNNPSPISVVGNIDYKVIGENLLNKDTVTKGKFIYDNKIQTNANFCYSDFIKVRENANYIWNFAENGGAFISYYDKEKKYLSQWSSNNNVAHSTPENCEYVILSFHIANLENAMFVKGDKIPSQFKIYQEQSTTIELPENEFMAKIGEYEDYTDDTGVLHKRIKKLVLNGTEDWLKHSNGCFYPNTNLVNNVKLPINNIEVPLLKCTHFITDSYANTWINRIDNSISFAVNGTNNPRIRADRFTTVDEFKSWLAQQYANGTPVEVYYVLAEPYLSELPLESKNKYKTLPTIEGVNNISITADTTATYNTNTELNKVYAKQNYVLEKFAEQTITNDAIINRVGATEINVNNQINGFQGELRDVKSNYAQLSTTVSGFNFDVVEKIEKQLANGEVTSNSVNTTTVKINNEGIHVKKSGSEMQSLLDNEGLYVNKGDIDKSETKNNTLTVDKNGVVTENLVVRTYLTAGYHRTEGFIEDGEKRTGIFYSGGET